MPHDALGDAAQHDVREAGPPMRPDHDGVRADGERAMVIWVAAFPSTIFAVHSTPPVSTWRTRRTIIRSTADW